MTAHKQKSSFMSEIMKDPEMVMKFNELKKKIQSSILSGDKPKLSNDKI